MKTLLSDISMKKALRLLCGHQNILAHEKLLCEYKKEKKKHELIVIGKNAAILKFCQYADN